jgi:uncharacterized ferredoxin-like protein
VTDGVNRENAGAERSDWVEILPSEMTMKTSAELEQQAALQVASLMAAAARTAPKTCGIDNIRVIGIEDPATKDRLVSKMRELAKSEDRSWFERDATCVENSLAVLLIGVAANPASLNCGYCGHGTCEEMERTNGICSFNSIDLGIAVSSAVSVAADSRVDTRIMFSVGHAGLAMNLFEGGVKQALGIPLSITGKSPFFDRKP